MQIFSLPYYCCSKAPNVQYVLSKAQPLILFGQNNLCSNDENIYPITGVPAGGRFEPQSEPWLVEQGGQLGFQPSAVPIRYYDPEGVAKMSIAYVFDDQIATIEVVVTKQANASYTVVGPENITDPTNPCRLLGIRYIFRNTSEIVGGDISLENLTWELEGQTVDGEENGDYIHEVLFASLDGRQMELNPTLIISGKQEACLSSFMMPEPIIIECPDISIGFTGSTRIDQEADPINSGSQIDVFVYRREADLQNGTRRFRINVDPKIGSFTVNRINQGQGAVPQPPVPTNLLVEPNDQNNCRYAFIYDVGTNGPARFIRQPDGLYLFEYSNPCNPDLDPIQNYVRLETDPGAVPLNVAVANRTISTTKNPAPAKQEEAKTKPAKSKKAKAETKVKPEAKAKVDTKAKPSKEVKAKVTPKLVASKVESTKTPSKAEVVFRRRITDRRRQLTKLEQDKSLVKTKTFQETKNYLASGQADIAVAELRFNEIMNRLLKSYKGTSSQKRKEQYEVIMGIILHGFWDRLVFTSPNQVPDSVKKRLSEFVPSLKAEGLDFKKILDTWDSSELKKATTASSIEELEKLLSKTE